MGSLGVDTDYVQVHPPGGIFLVCRVSKLTLVSTGSCALAMLQSTSRIVAIKVAHRPLLALVPIIS